MFYVDHKLEDLLSEFVAELNTSFKTKRKYMHEFTEEKNLDLKIHHFLSNSLQNNTIFRKTYGGTFKISGSNNEEIKVDTKDSQAEVTLSVNEFKRVVESGIEFSTSRDLARKVFNLKHQRQKDTYYHSLAKAFRFFDFSGYENVREEYQKEKLMIILKC